MPRTYPAILAVKFDLGHFMSSFPEMRLRRLRRADWSRRLISETRPSVNDLVWTTVVTDSATPREAVTSLPGVERLNIDALVADAQECANLGIPAMAIFPHIDPSLKTDDAREALNAEGLVPRAVRAIKSEVPEIGVIVDVALDPYTSHGHDGLMEGDEILNDPSLDMLEAGAVILAEAGADIVAPSDMMDGRIGRVRRGLDAAGYDQVSILSYAAKFASAFYGPYRDAIGTKAALRGDKRTYQMNPGNREMALRECGMDVDEGADMLMVKPGLPYLDIVSDVKQAYGLPVVAFQVSGEFAMIKAAAQNGWVDYDAVLMETLTSFKRAGCDAVLTYGARDLARMLKS